MRVLVLGGAGAVCSETTRDLSRYSDFDEIVIAEYNTAAAERLAAELNDDRVRVVFFDANDYDAMVRLFRGFDVVVNGLPWKYDLVVTKAAVEAGVNGLDVSTEEDQWDYDAAARAKDIVFIPGVGATPGITNLMAARGASLMDRVDTIDIYFAAFRAPAPAPGLLVTFLWEFDPQTKERTYYKDGVHHPVGPFEGARRARFHDLIGEQEVVIIPHPETRTLPRVFGAREVAVRGCFPPHAMRLAKALLENGFYDERPVQVGDREARPLDFVYDLMLAMPGTKETPVWAYGLVVDVFGTRDGHPVHVRLWNEHPPQEEWGGPAAYYKNIGIPLSIGAQMIAHGQVKTKGVVPPEAALAPEPFFAELARRGIRIHEKVTWERPVMG